MRTVALHETLANDAKTLLGCIHKYNNCSLLDVSWPVGAYTANH